MKQLKRIIAVICIAVLLAGGAVRAEGHYSFKNIVTPSVMDEIFGEKRVNAYINLVNAVMEGKTSFACPDQDTYDWIIVQYPYRCFPLIAEYVHEPMGSAGWKKGTGYIEYSIPQEEFRQKLTEFKSTVTGILNSVLEDDMSDFEKALMLYLYFAEAYTYDYDTYYVMQDKYVENLSAYRFLMGGTGICQEVGTAYSYLLLQAGVDATIVMGDRIYDGGGHLWSYVTINGKNYHIDPTYALGKGGDLTWFMMTDEKRFVEDSYPKDDFTYSSCYSQCHDIPEFSAEDMTFSTLWGRTFERIDTVNNLIYLTDGSVFAYED